MIFGFTGGHLKRNLAGDGTPRPRLPLTAPLAPLRMFEQFQPVPKKNRLEQSAGAFCKQGGTKSPFPPVPILSFSDSHVRFAGVEKEKIKMCF